MSRRLNMFMTCERRLQRGAVLPLLAIGMLTIIGLIGLSIDVGHVFLNKTRLQNSLDSAALSGARTLMLSDDVTAAGADARDAFGEHLGGEMAGLDAGDLVLQYSHTLVPFVAGGSEPRYVRAAVESFATDVFFSGVLQDVGRSMSIAGTAVAGPVPLGYPDAERTCDIAPLLMCGTHGDSDCSDGSCFGYRVGARREYALRLRPGVDNAPRDLDESGLYGLQISECGEGSIFYDCIPTPIGASDPGNFLLHELACSDENCVRESVAGSFDSCLTVTDPVRVESIGTPAPLIQGLMARFGVDDSLLSPADYPPDVVATDRTDDVDYWYDSYRRDVASVIAAGSDGSGVPYRRVVTVPVVSCQDDAVGQSANTLLGFLCLFLTRRVDEGALTGVMYGQFVDRCEASGEQGASVPAVSDNYDGPVEIVLYKDPDSDDS